MKQYSTKTLLWKDIVLIPNLLSLARVALLVPCLYFMALTDLFSQIATLAIYGMMVATDFLDGFLARKWALESTMGRILDPVSDKVVIIGMAFGLTVLKDLPLSLVLFLLAAQLLIIVGGVMLASKKMTVVESNLWGKWATTFFALSGVLMIFFSFYSWITLIAIGVGWVLFMLTLITYTYRFFYLMAPHLVLSKSVSYFWMTVIYTIMSVGVFLTVDWSKGLGGMYGYGG